MKNTLYFVFGLLIAIGGSYVMAQVVDDTATPVQEEIPVGLAKPEFQIREAEKVVSSYSNEELILIELRKINQNLTLIDSEIKFQNK